MGRGCGGACPGGVGSFWSSNSRGTELLVPCQPWPLVEQGLEPGEAEVHPGRAREGAGSVSNLLVTCPRARSGRGEGGGGLPPTPGCVGDGMWVLALSLGSGRTQPVASGALLQALVVLS